MSSETTDVAIVGGGIVGLATAIALVESPGGPSVALFEKEHTTITSSLEFRQSS